MLKRLEVNVRRLGLDALLEHEVDEADDRSLAGLLGDILIGDGGGIDFAEFAQQLFHRRGSGFAVDARDGGLDLRRIGHGQFDILLQDEAEFADDGRIERVLRKEGEFTSLVSDGQHDVLVGLRRL